MPPKRKKPAARAAPAAATTAVVPAAAAPPPAAPRVPMPMPPLVFEGDEPFISVAYNMLSRLDSYAVGELVEFTIQLPKAPGDNAFRDRLMQTVFRETQQVAEEWWYAFVAYPAEGNTFCIRGMRSHVPSTKRHLIKVNTSE